MGIEHISLDVEMPWVCLMCKFLPILEFVLSAKTTETKMKERNCLNYEIFLFDKHFFFNICVVRVVFLYIYLCVIFTHK